MKNEYFGDINDYRKYGLLRVLGEVARVDIAVCWMLAPDDGRETDVKYLNDQKKWGGFDPELFKFLQKKVIKHKVRNVKALEGTNVLPGCRFFSDLVPGRAGPRREYFERLLELARGTDLIFFDPDTGIRMKSARMGQRRSTKHLYKDEVSASFAAGHSLLIYQHFPRLPHDRFTDKLAHDLEELTGAEVVFSYRTPRMVFFLVPQRGHSERFMEANIKVERRWGPEIRVKRHGAGRKGGKLDYRPQIRKFETTEVDVQSLKQRVQEEVDRLAPELVATSRFLHANPELAYEEHKAAERLTATLEQHGFAVTRGLAGLPTAFLARTGSGTPRLAFLAEYDALPGLGHACGHNLIGTASLGAALAVKAVLHVTPGEVLVVGCPAEEKGGGKIDLVQAGIFAGVDAAMLVHPSNRTEMVKLALGMREVSVEFFGKASHAAAAPERGINALDAVILGYTGVSALRQQVRSDARIHGIITHGGQAPNIIPDYAAARFYVRALDLPYLDELFWRVMGCFEAAAQATGCRVKITPAGKDYHPYKPVYALAELFQRNLESVGETVDQGPVDRELGSTDVGNVSQVVPTIQPMLQISPREVTCHMTAFAEAAVSDVGHRGMLSAAKAMAMTGVDLLAEPASLRRVADEFHGPPSS